MHRHDRRRAWRDWEHWGVDGRCRDKHDPSVQQRWVRIGVDDGGRGRPGACSLEGHGSGRADRMQGHRVGVRMSVRCMLGQGACGSRRTVMTAGDRGGSGSAVYSVDPGELSLTQACNRAAIGSALVTVRGAGLGLTLLSALARSGQTGCEGTDWESETSMRCLMGRGAQGTNRGLRLPLGALASCLTRSSHGSQ